jgi:hypothetical protein
MAAVILAANTTATGYEILLFLHVLAVIAAFGPALLYTLGVEVGAAKELTDLHTKISIPAVVLVGILGFALVGASDKAWTFSQAWVPIAAVVWLLVVLDAVALLRPALAEAATGKDKKAQVAMATGLMHLGMVVAIFLMVFKPGA